MNNGKRNTHPVEKTNGDVIEMNLPELNFSSTEFSFLFSLHVIECRSSKSSFRDSWHWKPIINGSLRIPAGWVESITAFNFFLGGGLRLIINADGMQRFARLSQPRREPGGGWNQVLLSRYLKQWREAQRLRKSSEPIKRERQLMSSPGWLITDGCCRVCVCACVCQWKTKHKVRVWLKGSHLTAAKVAHTFKSKGSCQAVSGSWAARLFIRLFQM